MPAAKKKPQKKPRGRISQPKKPWYEEAKAPGPSRQWHSRNNPQTNTAAERNSRRRKSYALSLIPRSIKDAVRKYNEGKDDLLIDYYKEVVLLWCKDHAPYYQFVENGDKIRIDVLRIPPYY